MTSRNSKNATENIQKTATKNTKANATKKATTTTKPNPISNQQQEIKTKTVKALQGFLKSYSRDKDASKKKVKRDSSDEDFGKRNRDEKAHKSKSSRHRDEKRSPSVSDDKNGNHAKRKLKRLRTQRFEPKYFLF